MGKGMQGRVKRERDCGERRIKGERRWGKGCGKGKDGKGLWGDGCRKGEGGNGIVGKRAAGRRVRGGEFGGKGLQFAYKLSTCSQQVCSVSSFGGRRLKRATGGFLNPFTAPARIISGLKSPHTCL